MKQAMASMMSVATVQTRAAVSEKQAGHGVRCEAVVTGGRPGRSSGRLEHRDPGGGRQLPSGA
jgi:hypothetical protein